MNMFDTILVILMAIVVLFVLKGSLSSLGHNAKEEDAPKKAGFAKRFRLIENKKEYTCISLRYYCWIASLPELNSNTSKSADTSYFKGPISLVSSREDGTIRIINTERGTVRSSECDLDISEYFPSDADELYYNSNRCFSHHEATISTDQKTGGLHLFASEEKLRKKKPLSIYTYPECKPVTDTVLKDGTCVIIGDYLFAFTRTNSLPADILTEDEPAKKTAAKKERKTRRQASATKKRAASASAKK